MSKHTPGPWFQGTGDYAYCVYDKRVWLNPDGSRGGDTPNLVVVVSPEDAIADARLIAAAPDLLEALKEERRIRLIGQSPECGQSHWESMRDLRRAAYDATDAAIAKATGEKA